MRYPGRRQLSSSRRSSDEVFLLTALLQKFEGASVVSFNTTAMMKSRGPNASTIATQSMVLLLLSQLALFASAQGSTSCPRVCVDVAQGPRYFGQFHPVTTAGSLEDFYAYGDDTNFSFNGDDVVPLIPDQSLFMVHYDVSACDLGFAIVHDSKEEYTGGQVRMFVSGNVEDAVVLDGRNNTSDRCIYRGDDLDDTEFFWEWGWQHHQYRTDGMADFWNVDERQCLTVKAKFITGIVAWRFVPGPASHSVGTAADPEEYLYLDMDEVLTVCKGSCGQPMHPVK